MERYHCSQRVMVPVWHFQAMRPSVSRRRGQSPRYREYARLAPGRAKSQVPRDARYWWTYQRHRGNAGTMVLTHKRAPPPPPPPRKGRPTPKLAGD